jgi:hypothetical protein
MSGATLAVEAFGGEGLLAVSSKTIVAPTPTPPTMNPTVATVP